MIDHPIFQRFAPYRRSDDDWLGAHFPVDFSEERPRCPPADQQLFEWIAMLEAVFRARERFVMIELGAGFGRWGIWSALAAKAVGIDNIEVRLIEAEPQHAAWAREGVRLNGLDRPIRVIEAAISNDPGFVPFAIDAPRHDYDAASWYGQAILSGEAGSGTLTDEPYFGHKVYRNQWYGYIRIPTVTLANVCEGLDRIDFIDADVQGAEIEFLPYMDLLTKSVRCICIGTHSDQIEAALRQAFRAGGWVCQWDFSLLGQRGTPFGPMDFQDGVQIWLNPSLP